MKKIRIEISDTLYSNNDLIVKSIRLAIGLVQLKCEEIGQEKKENIFILDYPSQIVDSYKRIQDSIERSVGTANKDGQTANKDGQDPEIDSKESVGTANEDSQDPEIDSKEISEFPDTEIRNLFLEYDQYNNRFFNTDHEIFLIYDEKKCFFPDENIRKCSDAISLQSSKPCLHKNCPLLKFNINKYTSREADLGQFIPSELHQQEANKLYEFLSEKSVDCNHITLINKYDEDKNSQELESLDWQKLISSLEDELKDKFSKNFSITLAQMPNKISREKNFKNSYEKNFSLDYIDTFKILIIYINQFEESEDSQKNFVKESTAGWEKFRNANNLANVKEKFDIDYREYPKDSDISSISDKSGTGIV